MKHRPDLRALLFSAGTILLVLCSSCSERPDVVASTSNPPFEIQPNVSVGRVHAGMHITNVIAQFGEPQRRTANALEYTKLGFAVMPDSDGVVQVVMCGDVTGINGPLVQAFKGRTKEGIGLGSTRDELLKALGDPSSSEKLRGGMESIRYDRLGMTFTLEAGKVYHIIVRLPVQQQPDISVTLDPSTPPASR